MILTILDAKNPSLRQKSKSVKKVDKKVITLIEDMKETLLVQDDPEGVGLAAPQVGKNIRLFLMRPEDEIKVVINPKVISINNKTKSTDKNKKIMEGCLSLPHFYGPLERSSQITIEYQDETGQKQINKFVGFEAQIVQHEIDHLEGILFVDRLLKAKKPLYEWVNGEWEKVDI
jgi:peptide deformylase